MITEAYLLILLVTTAFIAVVAKMLQISHHNNICPTSKIARIANYLLPLLIIIFCIRSFAYEFLYIPSQSMQPTLMQGDIIIVDKFRYGLRVPIIGKRLSPGTPQTGDIAVFRGIVNQKPTALVKRVVGLPGDHIQYTNRTLYINHLAVQQHDINADTITSTEGKILPVIQATETLDAKEHRILLAWQETKFTPLYPEVLVGQNSYYMLGDYRDDSLDSRDTGTVHDQKLIGKAHFILFSIDWHQRKVRWDRIGKIYTYCT